MPEGEGGGGRRAAGREAACNALAGAAAGAIAATVVCPLDVIKTRLQVYGLPSNLSSGAVPPGRVIFSGLQDILKNEGFRGLYRGLSPTIVALLPTWAEAQGVVAATGVPCGSLMQQRRRVLCM